MLESVAREQALDAVFDLMRWPDGTFSFVMDDADPDDLEVGLPVDEVVTEGRRRLQHWAALTELVPAPGAVVSFSAAPP